MDYMPRLTMSYYKTIAVINESHNIFLVQHQESGKIYVKKILDVYNKQIYQNLYRNKIPGVPQIVELYEADNQLTVIEEFVSGSSLQEKIAMHDMSAASITHYMCELCEILERLHSVKPSIIHRDIKPSNIIITSYDHVMLLDFNAAKYFADANTADTILLGTKGYAAPEQYGFGASTPQTDIYASGILLKELVDSLPEPTTKFSEIIDTCTQMNPADRFQTASALKSALQKTEHPFQSDPSGPFTWKKLIPPGYRTRTPWKIAVSSIAYIYVFWLCLSLEFENTAGVTLWLERLFCLLMVLSVICCSFNYCNVQRIFPLCRHKNRILHYIGIVILDVIIVLYLFMVLTIIETIFFA